MGQRRNPVRSIQEGSLDAVRRMSVALLGAALFLLSVEGNAMAETVNFDNAATGAAPEGWTLTKTGRGQPKWTVEAESTAPSKPNVLKQSGQATFPVALRNGTSILDGFVEVKFKAIAGSEDRAAGIVWRARDADNYYVVRANALEDNVVLYKTIKGVRSALDIVGRKGGYGVKVSVPSGQWHSLRCEFAGKLFKVTYDGKPMFEVEDESIRDAGMIGLWTKADSVTVFDDLTYGALN
ncbi:hypothetical protein JQ614_20025 [Bradyrhizobium diazoefficiens]|nr:hypothetical protein [Bradyrhizobium diazoefficiens]MBR0863877.1 hypothetical protein [Bradyrhizobium diazoefficiens]MBR0888508.1 hypothetical protein [Bradyrhizobium diazoefficiens]MBR0920328.1 hypothetical protein [Bradyrhizobium diazoefficiens]